MPDIVVQFTGSEIDAILAQAATEIVNKSGFSANSADVLYEIAGEFATPTRAKVIVRNNQHSIQQR